MPSNADNRRTRRPRIGRSRNARYRSEHTLRRRCGRSYLWVRIRCAKAERRDMDQGLLVYNRRYGLLIGIGAVFGENGERSRRRACAALECGSMNDQSRHSLLQAVWGARVVKTAFLVHATLPCCVLALRARYLDRLSVTRPARNLAGRCDAEGGGEQAVQHVCYFSRPLPLERAISSQVRPNIVVDNPQVVFE